MELSTTLSAARRALAPVAVAFACALVAVARPSATAAPSSQASAPSLAVIGGDPAGTSSAVYLVPAGASSLPAPWARFQRLPYPAVRGALLDDQHLAVVADRAGSRDRSWASALLLVEPGRAERVLTDEVYHASRPLPLPDKRIAVVRGRAGDLSTADAAAGRLRTDELAIDVVALDGATTRLWSGLGYTVHLLAARAGAIWALHVAAGRSELIAIDARGGGARIAGAVPAIATDLSLDDRGRLIYATSDGHSWRVERLDPSSGALDVLGRSAGYPAPAVAAGRVLWSADGAGLGALVGDGVAAPFGRGLDRVRAVSTDGRWIAVDHRDDPTASDAAAQLLSALRPSDGVLLHLPSGSTPFEVVGFVGGAR